jgi:hypothetical protein
MADDESGQGEGEGQDGGEDRQFTAARVTIDPHHQSRENSRK